MPSSLWFAVALASMPANTCGPATDARAVLDDFWAAMSVADPARAAADVTDDFHAY